MQLKPLISSVLSLLLKILSFWVIGLGKIHKCCGSIYTSFQEIDISVITKARLFVDYIPSALAQAKEILYGIENKIFNENFILGEIGEVLAGNKTGRRGQEDITVYRSLGIAAQDLVCKQYVLKKSNKLKTGNSVKIL